MARSDTHINAAGTVLATGTWKATGLIDYQSYSCGVDIGDPIPPNFCGGRQRHHPDRLRWVTVRFAALRHRLKARDRAGLLADITAVISGAGSNIHNLESRPDRTNARIDANLEIADKRQLETILANLKKITGVFGVERVYQPGQ